MKITKQMNIFLWVLQILLALYNFAGGLYLSFNYEKIASVWALSALPAPAWMALGLLQALFAIGLVVRFKKMPNLTGISAVCLAIISLLGVVLYIAYAHFPGMLWGVAPAILLAFIAYKRWR